MLYHLLYPLRTTFIGFNLLGYITVRSAAAAVTALVVTFIVGPRIISWLKQKQIGEEIASKVWGYPYIPLFFLSCTFILMILTYINRPLESTAAVITILAGVPCYWLWIKRVKNSPSLKNERARR